MPKTTKKSLPLRTRIFLCFILVTAVLLGVLWLSQTVFFGLFYRQVKTDELKKATLYVAENLDKADIQNRILVLSSGGQISIRVIDTAAFSDLYTSGDNVYSVISGIGVYELFKIYEAAVENGGELTQYYTDTSGSEEEKSFIERKFSEQRPGFSGPYGHFETASPSPFSFVNGQGSDLVYAILTTRSDGGEMMVVAHTKLTPLDTTVTTLRYQLTFATLLTLILSLLISFIISKIVSSPIEKLNHSSLELAKGKYDTRFEAKGYREIEQLSDTLNFTASELGKVEKMQRELVANVSHDMRTPLTMIVGYGEAMRDIPGENTPENVQVIIDEANRLSEFVNSVLDLSKLQSGQKKLNFEDICLTELLESITQRYRKFYLDSGYKVVLDAPERVNIRCDITQMSQAILNLVDNAVNYTGKDKTVYVKQHLVSDECVRIEVCDSGEGIPTEALPYIWDRYYKSKSSHRRNVAGSGIGLSIVRQVFEKHGARYGVESEIGKGSTFWFELEVLNANSN